jgi:hypothetical protein
MSSWLWPRFLLLAEFLNSQPEHFEEFGVIYHAAIFTVT